jgi:ADP-ribose pyrophosphatase YjhB (NUDIX family)
VLYLVKFNTLLFCLAWCTISLVNRSKQLLSKLWKLIPAALRWRAISALSPRFVVGVAGIVLNEQGEVLLAHHVFRGEYAWGFPGGIVGHSEGLIQATHREILEETHLQVAVGPLLQVSMGEQWPNVTFHFFCTIAGSPQPQVNGELFEAGFYPPAALPGALKPVQESALAAALTLFQQPDSIAAVRIVETEQT